MTPSGSSHGDCALTGACPGRGTVTLAFSQPVRNPTIHMSGIGSAIDNGRPSRTSTASGPDLHQGHPHQAGRQHPVLCPPAPVITTANDSASTYCDTTTSTAALFPAAASAACGSVQVTGTVTPLTFTMSADSLPTPAASGPYNPASSGEPIEFAVTLPQDFGDAPATYNRAHAPLPR